MVLLYLKANTNKNNQWEKSSGILWAPLAPHLTSLPAKSIHLSPGFSSANLAGPSSHASPNPQMQPGSHILLLAQSDHLSLCHLQLSDSAQDPDTCPQPTDLSCAISILSANPGPQYLVPGFSQVSPLTSSLYPRSTSELQDWTRRTVCILVQPTMST